VGLTALAKIKKKFHRCHFVFRFVADLIFDCSREELLSSLSLSFDPMVAIMGTSGRYLAIAPRVGATPSIPASTAPASVSTQPVVKEKATPILRDCSDSIFRGCQSERSSCWMALCAPHSGCEKQRNFESIIFEDVPSLQ
jgi:hypothetical protein